MTSSSRLSAIALLLVVALVPACAEDADDRRGAIAHPDGEQVVLQIRRTGGLPRPDRPFTDVPQVTILGNGRTILE
ncbi:MAG: hypothetical protein M3179_05760, partial [Actinomycetota bacterium]|nr:hypothetical protein [Actinomycetota bacterium]